MAASETQQRMGPTLVNAVVPEATMAAGFTLVPERRDQIVLVKVNPTAPVWWPSRSRRSPFQPGAVDAEVVGQRNTEG